MIISEKQIFTLLNIGQAFLQLLDTIPSDNNKIMSRTVAELLHDIQIQQSDKLKEIE